MQRHVRILVALALLAGSAQAQSPWSLSIAGGASVPSGRFADASSVGWHALVSLGLGTLMLPQGVRLDVAHNRFTAKAAGPDQALTSATLNLTYRLPMTDSPLSPYLITGAGAYRLECYGTIECGSTTRFGWNAGLGVKIAALGGQWFVESRLHAVNSSRGHVRLIPITLGLTF